MDDSDSVKSESFQSLEDGSFETSESELEQSSDDDTAKHVRQVAADPAAVAAALSRPLPTSSSFRISHHVSTCPGTRHLEDEPFSQPPGHSVDEDEDITKNPMWIARARRLEHKWRCYDARLIAFSLTRDVRKDQSSTVGDVGVSPLDPAAGASATARSLRFRLNGASSRYAIPKNTPPVPFVSFSSPEPSHCAPNPPPPARTPPPPPPLAIAAASTHRRPAADRHPTPRGGRAAAGAFATRGGGPGSARRRGETGASTGASRSSSPSTRSSAPSRRRGFEREREREGAGRKRASGGGFRRGAERGFLRRAAPPWRGAVEKSGPGEGGPAEGGWGSWVCRGRSRRDSIEHAHIFLCTLVWLRACLRGGGATSCLESGAPASHKQRHGLSPTAFQGPRFVHLDTDKTGTGGRGGQIQDRS
jgi:hypothetical protein